MPATGLDHVNIIARDLDASARFYAQILGLQRRDPPGSLPTSEVQWLYDSKGGAIIHLTAATFRANAGRVPGGPTGGLHHVAFACDDYDGTIARLEAAGVPYRSNATIANVRQIFLADPSDVVLELNFRG